MYLHIGQNEILPDRRVIGIFDLDKCSYGKRTREYLAGRLLWKRRRRERQAASKESENKP